MRTVGVLLAVATIVMLAFGIRVEAESISWTNPTKYVDNTSIPAAAQAQLKTEIAYRVAPTTTFTTYGTATGGASAFSGPSVTPSGGTSYWRARSISVLDNNATSAWSPEHPFVKGYQPPGAPGSLHITE